VPDFALYELLRQFCCDYVDYVVLLGCIVANLRLKAIALKVTVTTQPFSSTLGTLI
jgi:hypothetical protein